MDYYEIGQRVRRYRKILGLSQEQLAEKVGISVTHMSHIETGNTKLSLPIFVSLAEHLGVQADDLLFDKPSGRHIALKTVDDILNGCTTPQIRVLAEILAAAKVAMDKYSG